MKWEAELLRIEAIFQEMDLIAQYKWGTNIYYHNNEMVVAVGGFKNHFSIWFYKGVFMEDKHGKLINAQEGKTKGLRQWRFTSAEQIDTQLIQLYVAEAITIAKQNRSLPKTEEPSNLVIEPFNRILQTDLVLQEKFFALAPYKQKEYLLYFQEAKKEMTQRNRIEKAIPLILAGSGLHDKYKK